MHVDFHGFLQMSLFLGSIASVPVGIVYKYHWLWASGLGSIFLYPVVLEALVYGWACSTNTESRYKKNLQEKRLKMVNYLPLIYHKGYNLTACGLEKKHPFDAIKYQRYHCLMKNHGITH